MGQIIKAEKKPSFLEQARDMITGGGSSTFAIAYGVMAIAEVMADIAKAVASPDVPQASWSEVFGCIGDHGLDTDEKLTNKLMERFDIRVREVRS